MVAIKIDDDDVVSLQAAEEQQAAIMQLIHKYEAEDVLGKLSDSGNKANNKFHTLLKSFNNFLCIFLL